MIISKTIVRAGAILAVIYALPAVLATGPTSTNYAIAWDTLDGGGETASSVSYVVQDTVAQTSATGSSVSVSYTVSGGFHTPPDFDEDGLRNFVDNCLYESNTNQYDSNGDGYGNRCDPDLNNDGVINAVDLGILKSRFFTADPDADFDGNGVVNTVDLGIMKARFFGVPGPSGIAP